MKYSIKISRADLKNGEYKQAKSRRSGVTDENQSMIISKLLYNFLLQEDEKWSSQQ